MVLNQLDTLSVVEEPEQTVVEVTKLAVKDQEKITTEIKDKKLFMTIFIAFAAIIVGIIMLRRRQYLQFRRSVPTIVN